jgi:pyruvyltransferase
MSWGKVEKNNWGDDINVFLLKYISKTPLFYAPLWTNWADNHIVYSAIGSIIQWIHNPNTIVWGSGFIDDVSIPEVLPKKILAVRGPLTRARLLEMGVECPAVYGDPALLLPYYYRPKVQKKYKLGIIPHVSNYYKHVLDKYKENKDVSVIKLFDYRNWKEVVDAILECDFIASSSLHGIIAAESYGVPNIWVEFEEPIAGKTSNRYKFHDYFLSQGYDVESPYVISEKTTIEDVLSLIEGYDPLRRNYSIAPLVNVCPFELKKPLMCFE